jgi:hypothetical protein
LGIGFSERLDFEAAIISFGRFKVNVRTGPGGSHGIHRAGTGNYLLFPGQTRTMFPPTIDGVKVVC